MKVSQIIFSPTGGTEKVADAITNTWELPVNKIDLSNAEADYSSLSFEDSLFRYLRLCLLSMYVKAAKITSTNVSTSNVFIPTSFPFPERTTADYP